MYNLSRGRLNVTSSPPGTNSTFRSSENLEEALTTFTLTRLILPVSIDFIENPSGLGVNLPGKSSLNFTGSLSG